MGNDWLVRIDQWRLFRTIHGVAARGSGRLLLNVAQDLEFEVVVERASPTLSGYSLSGRVAGVAGGVATFAAGAEVLAGIVWTPGAVYELAHRKDGVHVFRQVDLSVRPRLAEPIRTEGGWDALVAVDQAAADGGTVDSGNVADVLVLWTPKVREIGGGEAQTRVGVDAAIAWANDAYERSGAEVRLNLVGAEEVDYVESGNSSVDLNRLKNPSDGFMDEAHERRDALGADLVSFFTAGGDAAGVATTPGSFSFVGVSPASLVYRPAGLFAHELGHNMGLSHDRYTTLEIARSEGLLPFSYGYVNNLALGPAAAGDDCFATIMAYIIRCDDAGLPTFGVPYFSTPDLRYPDGDGAPLGVPKSSDEEWADGPADAVRALNLNLPRIVNYHRGRGDDGDTAGAATPVVATSNTLATLANSDDVDYFRIELPEAGSLRAETTGGGRLRGTLTAEDGEPIAADDRWDPPDFLISAELEAGVYFVKVEAYSGWDWWPPDSAFSYALAVSFKPESAADDHGDTASSATATALPSSTAGELESPSDADFFRFEVAERRLVRVGTSGETDVVGTLASEDGTIALTDDDDGPALNFLIAAKLDPGVYFVSVRGFGGDATGAYSLDISSSPPADDHADFPAGATDVAVGASVGGELEAWLDEDHFRVDVQGLGAGQLWVESRGARLEGALVQPDGELIAEGGSRGPDFAVGAHVAPGTYILRVAGASGVGRGSYEVAVSFIADSRSIPLFLSASDPRRWSFARIVNRDDRPGMVAIHAVDDAGRRRAPVFLSLAARQTAYFNSAELENGSVAKGLSGGVGAGEGDWRLELETDLDIEALAYVRTEEGFLASLHDAATCRRNGHFGEAILATFNPASGRQVGRLRLAYAGPLPDHVSIFGQDDHGRDYRDHQLRQRSRIDFWLGARTSRTLSARELEAGGLGDGDGMWRLYCDVGWAVSAMGILESPAGNLSNLTGRAAQVGRNVSLPLFTSASNGKWPGFARIVNRDDRPGTVAIHAIDDAGRRRGPVTLPLAADEARHFDSDDLEVGSRERGLSSGVGAGTGDWRLELAADVDIEALAYVRMPDGFLTGMNALAPVAADGRREVVFFNPASNDQRVSRLRLVNPAAAPARIVVSGLDDHGAAPPDGDVALTLPAGAATSITAQQLEAGASHFDGRFGDGRGKWRLFIEADRDIQAMSLVESPTGHLTNLSSGKAVR